MPRNHALSDLRFIKTRGQWEASCSCGWALTAPEKQESMARSNYDLHERRHVRIPA